MRSRLTITATLAAGLLFSGGGAALGVSALTTSPSASVAQYGGTTTTTTTTTTTGAVVGQGQPPTGAPLSQGVEGEAQTPATLGVGTSGEEEELPVDEAVEATQAPRQLEAQAADDDELPFTGYAAIPILLMGIALLITGLVLRRRASAAPPSLS